MNVRRVWVHSFAVGTGLRAQIQCRTLRAASVKSVQSVRKYHAWNLRENVTYGIRVPLSIAQLYVQYVVLSKKSRAVSHDTAHAKRDIIKT